MAVTQTDKKPNYFIVIISLVVIIIAVAIVVFVRCPSGAIIYVMRVLMAIGAGGFVTMLNPSIKIENKIVKAGGAIAFAVLVYLINPPKLLGGGNDDCLPKKDFITGTVFIKGKPVSEAQVDLLSDIQIAKKTNSIGSFDKFIIANENRPDSLKLRIQYSMESTLQPVDTTLSFKTEDVLNKNIEIRLNPPPKPQSFAGYIWDQNGHGLQDVVISAAGVKDTTDNGFCCFGVLVAQLNKKEQLYNIRRYGSTLLKTDSLNASGRDGFFSLSFKGNKNDVLIIGNPGRAGGGAVAYYVGKLIE